MAEDFRNTLEQKYDLADALQGICTLCSTESKPIMLEVYRHREIPAIIALFCPRFGSLFQADLFSSCDEYGVFRVGDSL